MSESWINAYVNYLANKYKRYVYRPGITLDSLLFHLNKMYMQIRKGGFANPEEVFKKVLRAWGEPPIRVPPDSVASMITTRFPELEPVALDIIRWLSGQASPEVLAKALIRPLVQRLEKELAVVETLYQDFLDGKVDGMTEKFADLASDACDIAVQLYKIEYLSPQDLGLEDKAVMVEELRDYYIQAIKYSAIIEGIKPSTEKEFEHAVNELQMLFEYFEKQIKRIIREL